MNYRQTHFISVRGEPDTDSGKNHEEVQAEVNRERFFKNLMSANEPVRGLGGRIRHQFRD